MKRRGHEHNPSSPGQLIEVTASPRASQGVGMAPAWLDQNNLMFVRPVTSSEKTTGLGTPALRSPWTCLVWCHGVIACIPINTGKDLSHFLFIFCTCLMLSLGFLFFQLCCVAFGMLNRARHRQCIGMRALE